jgi:uncharacterized cupin superfamily protein
VRRQLARSASGRRAIIDPVKRNNVFKLDLAVDADDPQPYDETRWARLGPGLGAELLGGSVYELAPGGAVCPYHYEHGDEEWLLVLAGRPTIRHPGGEDELEPGDVVCFPRGPDGAHKVSNASDAPARVLIMSTLRMPAVCVYPDSGKVGVFTEGKQDDGMFRRETSVDYYEGEV